MWPSAAVAGLFAWHPLHVESVAWAAERKDVLSTFFFLLALLAYTGYTRVVTAREAENRSPGETQTHRYQVRGAAGYYGLTLVLFAFGLMSKPMVVTFPFILLLLDVWPFQRLEWPRASATAASTGTDSAGPVVASNGQQVWSKALKLMFEKLPFFGLSLVASVVTFCVQQGAASSLEILPLHRRASNAVLAYGEYIGKTLWPANLSVIYPYPVHLSAARFLVVLSFLLALTVCVGLQVRRRPYLFVGWFWYLGTLVPTIGLIQVGSQSMADRYMYIPSIGLFLLLVWGARDLLAPWPSRPKVLAGAGAVALAGCLLITREQLTYWQNSETLFRHALLVTKENYIAYDALGSALDEQGNHKDALDCYFEAVRLKPHYAEAQYDLGTALMKDGRTEEAISHFTSALADNPRFVAAHINLGKALLIQGLMDEAAAHLSRAAELAPGDPDALYNLGTVLLMQSKLEAAAGCFSKALQLNPASAQAHSNLGVALMRMGKPTEGAAQFTEALRLSPKSPDGYFNLGLALLEEKKPNEAADQFSQALRLDPNSPKTHYHLALALSQGGKSDQASAEAAQARSLALNTGQTQLAAKAEALLRDLPRSRVDPSTRRD